MNVLAQSWAFKISSSNYGLPSMIDLQVLSDILLWKSIDFISLKRSNLFLHYPKAYVFDYNDDHGSQSFLLTLASSGIRLGTP